MDRSEAMQLLREHLKNENLIKHCIACEAIMEALAEQLGQDQQIWSLAGLLHDLDYQKTQAEPSRHGLVGAQMLLDYQLPSEVIKAIQSHNPATGYQAQTTIEKALLAVDPVSGFIVACALIHPSRKLKNLDLNFLTNRFKEKSFARGASREQIQSCQEIGLSLEEFLEISLKAMQDRSEELGL